MSQMRCKECQEVKPFTEFVKNSASGPVEEWNLRKKCRDCLHLEYLARRAKPARRKKQTRAARNWKKNNPERHAEINQAYRARHPEKIVAQNRLGYAVRSGNVIKGPCEVCGTTDRVHGHHRSYRPEDWYDVRWLCYVCHKLEHTSAPKRARKAKVTK